MTNTVSETVSDETLSAIIQIESGGNPRAKAPTSSALGLGQFLNGTWMNVVRKHRPDLCEGVPEPKVLNMRIDPALSVELLARFTEDNLEAITGNTAPTDGDLYLAHFLGCGDARKLFHADPSTPVNLLVNENVIKANKSIMMGKTASQVRAWAARRMHECAGRDWVAKYYVAPEVTPAPDPEDPEPAAVHVDPLPDPTIPPNRPIDREMKKEVEQEDWIEYVKKIAKSRIQWAGTALTGLSISSVTGIFGDALKDPRVVMALIGGAVVLCVVIIIERGKKP